LKFPILEEKIKLELVWVFWGFFLRQSCAWKYNFYYTSPFPEKLPFWWEHFSSNIFLHGLYVDKFSCFNTFHHHHVPQPYV
jgi:hypothetical protein